MWQALIELVEKLVCCHDWNVHRTVRTYEKENDKYPMIIEQILICKKCGKTKKIKL